MNSNTFRGQHNVNIIGRKTEFILEPEVAEVTKTTSN